MTITRERKRRKSSGKGKEKEKEKEKKITNHARQQISVLAIPHELSVYCTTAPGKASKNAGHPQPDLNLVPALYNGVPQPK